MSILLANGETETRRPFTSINVESAPKPRNDTLEPPLLVLSLLFPCVENVPCPAIGSLVKSPIRSVTPLLAISSALKDVNGEGPSMSVLLMCEPVISIRSTLSFSAAITT